MSYLMSSFERRQVVSRRTPSLSGTVSSYDANSLIGNVMPDYNEPPGAFAGPREMPAVFNIDKCTDVRIGENITQIYNSCMSHVKWKLTSKKNWMPIDKGYRLQIAAMRRLFWAIKTRACRRSFVSRYRKSGVGVSSSSSSCWRWFPTSSWHICKSRRTCQ